MSHKINFRRSPNGSKILRRLSPRTIMNFTKDKGWQRMFLLLSSSSSSSSSSLSLLFVLQIKRTRGKSNTKGLIFLNFGIHAREWISPATGMYLIRQVSLCLDNCTICSILSNFYTKLYLKELSVTIGCKKRYKSETYSDKRRTKKNRCR